MKINTPISLVILMALALLTAFFCAPANASTLIYADDKVIGVRDVVIDHGDYSTSWNVEFISGVSYDDVFPTGEFFLDGEYTYAANQALASALSGLLATDLLCTPLYSYCQVVTPHLDYLDSIKCVQADPEGYVPSRPCEDGAAGYSWQIQRYNHMVSVYGAFVYLDGRINDFGLAHVHDPLYTGSEYARGRTGAPLNQIWAKWTPTHTPQPVPEPSGPIMLLVGVLFLVALSQASAVVGRLALSALIAFTWILAAACGFAVYLTTVQ
jgi:hypothetical protein